MLTWRSPTVMAGVLVMTLTGCADQTPTSPAQGPALAKGGGGSGIQVLSSVSLGFHATAIDEYGRVGGFASNWGKNTSDPVLWTPKQRRGSRGSLTTLPDLGGADHVWGMNDMPQLVGESRPAGSDYFHPVLWDQGILHQLDLPPGGIQGVARAILGGTLPSGQRLAVGRSCTPEGCLPTVWRVTGSGSGLAATAEALPSLGGGDGPWGVNEGGLVVGDDGGGPRPVKWSFDGSTWVRTELPLLEGSVSGRALAVNASGVIVGWHKYGAEVNRRAVIWPPNSAGEHLVAVELPRLPDAKGSEADAINDAGQVTGTYLQPNGAGGGESQFQVRNVLWVPQPEGGYELHLFGKPGRTNFGTALNEPELDGSGRSVLQLTDYDGILWTLSIP